MRTPKHYLAAQLDDALDVEIQGRCVLVSGGSSGIGHAIVKALVVSGARVGVISRRPPSEWAEALPKTWEWERDWLRADVGEAEPTLRAVDTWLDDIGGALDVFVHSAVSYGSNGRRGFAEMTLAEWDQVFAVNVRSLFYLTRHILPFLRRRPAALVLGISSEVAFHSACGRIDYGSSKAAAYQSLRSLAEEMAESNLRVVQLLPQGMVATPGIQRRRPPGDPMTGYAGADSFAPVSRRLVATLGEGLNGQSFIVTADGEGLPLDDSLLPSQTDRPQQA